MTAWLLRLVAVVGLELTAGCAAADSAGTAPPPIATTGVTVYAPGASGNAAPARVIAGERTGMQFPSAIAVDAHGNRYVADRDGDSITVFGSSARGDTPPLRTIAGTRTGLHRPTGLALDARGDVYVVNRSASTITVYAPTAQGNATPIRTIRGSTTKLAEPTSIALDARRYLYVTNLGDGSVLTFPPDANGDAAPVRIVRGQRTRITAAFAIAIDRIGAVYVVNSDDDGVTGVLVFPPGADGNVAPSRVIAGAVTKLETPSGVAVDARGDVFVSDHGGSGSAGAIRVFAKASQGSVAPLYSIAGTATRLRPYGLTIEPNGDLDAVNKTD